MVEDYSVLGIFSIASITQLLSMFGIAVGVNLMVWEYLVGGVGELVHLVMIVLSLLAWEDAYSYSDSTVVAEKSRA